MIASKFQLPFVKREKLNGEVYSFYFDKKASKFNFFSGQYFRVTLPIDNPDKRGSSRYFTISSSPNDKYLTITTKIIKSSFKLKLDSLNFGEKATFFGPFGDMYQNKKDVKPKVMLAGGIGLTPAHSMIKFIDEQKLKTKFTLLVSFSTKNDAIFFEELKEIASRNSNIFVVYFLTKEKENGFETGRINEKMIEKYVPNIRVSEVFLGGPPKMVFEIEKIIKKMGVMEKNIVVEDFSGY